MLWLVEGLTCSGTWSCAVEYECCELPGAGVPSSDIVDLLGHVECV